MTPLALMAVVVVGTLVALKVLPDPPPPDLFVVGDSVTFLSQERIEEQFDHSQVQFVARPGFTSTNLLPLVQDAMGAPGDPAHARQDVAVLVGYNDVRVNDMSTPSLAKMVDLTAQFRCGIWLTVPARPYGQDNENMMAQSNRVDLWNARVRDEVSKHPNLHLVDDWEQAVTNAPKGKVLKADGVHPNAAGQKVLAKIYRDAMDRYC